MLKVKNLTAKVAGKQILNGVNLAIGRGEVHVLMGPNGSGKSTLSAALMGRDDVTVTAGSIELNGVNITKMPTFKRARLGMFLAFQNPIELPGVSLFSALRINREIVKKEFLSISKFKAAISLYSSNLNLSAGLLERGLNEGASGGERKKNEILQLLLLAPRLAILDETDSGLDVSALKTVFEQVAAHKKDTGFLIITHYTRIFKYINPDFVHVFKNGKIIKSGNASLAREIEDFGYDEY